MNNNEFEEIKINDDKIQIISNESKETLREKAKRLAKDLQNKYTNLAEILYVIHSNEYWKNWGFISFEQYALDELGIFRRKAYYLRNIFEKVCKQLKIPKEKIEQESWSKMQKVASLFDLGVVNNENKEEWLEKAKELTVAELDAIVKNKQTDFVLQDVKKNNKKVNVTFKMFPELLEQYESSKRKYMEKFKLQDNEFNKEAFLSDVFLEFSLEQCNKLEEIDNLCSRIEQKFDGRYQMILFDLYKNKIIRNSNLGIDVEMNLIELLKQIENKFNIKLIAINKGNTEIIYGENTIKENLG